MVITFFPILLFTSFIIIVIFLLAAIRQKDDQIGRLRFQIDALRKENVFLFFIFVKCYLF